MISAFITNSADNVFCNIKNGIVDADNTGILMAAKYRILWPADIIGNPIF